MALSSFITIQPLLESSRKALTIALTVTLLLSFNACSSKSRKKSGLGDSQSPFSESDLDSQRDARFGNNSIPTAEGEGMFRDIQFEYNSSVITPEAQSDIEYNAGVLKSNSGLKVQLEGHCDERGTEEYNLTLGQARARAVRDVLSSLGVSSSKIETISYGENVPLDPGHSESSWTKNRRVHFSAGSATGDARGRFGGNDQTGFGATNSRESDFNSSERGNTDLGSSYPDNRNY
jgi:peptidoglycan-associated lipoprotein